MHTPVRSKRPQPPARAWRCIQMAALARASAWAVLLDANGRLTCRCRVGTGRLLCSLNQSIH